MVIEDSEIYCTWLSQCTLIDTFQVGFCKIFCSTAKSNCSGEHFFLKLLYHKIIKLILALLVLHTRLNHHNNLFCLSEALYCNVEGPGFLVGFILMETTVRSLFPSLFVLIDSLKLLRRNNQHKLRLVPKLVPTTLMIYFELLLQYSFSKLICSKTYTQANKPLQACIRE